MCPPENLRGDDQTAGTIKMWRIEAERVQVGKRDRCRHRQKDDDLHDQPCSRSRPTLDVPYDNAHNTQNIDQPEHWICLLRHQTLAGKKRSRSRSENADTADERANSLQK